MKIRQNIRHWAAKKALTTPVVGDVANDKLVDLHTSIFLNKADEERREERREHGMMHSGIAGLVGGLLVLVFGHALVLILGVTRAGLQARETEEPDDVDPAAAPGLDEDEASA